MMTSEKIVQIELDRITPSAGNRSVGGFDQTRLEQLAESIRAVGVQQPAVVRSKDDGYELVAGERRWRASKLAGLDTLPCVVREIDDATALHIQLIENLQREDIHPLDEAEGYSRLLDIGGYDVEHIAQEVGRSGAYVYQRLKLRDLVPKARALLVDGSITAGHAILIARLQPPQQTEVLEEILGQHWGKELSIRELDRHIRDRILMELSGATWKKDDDKLLPASGSCTSCSKRSGAAPELFGDLGKKDCCTDRACFEAKGTAMVARRKAELKGEEHLLVTERYGNAENGVLNRYDWTECKKKDEGAIKVLIVDGDRPGRLTWGKKRAGINGRYEQSPAGKAREKEEKAKAKKVLVAIEAVRETIYRQIMEFYKMHMEQQDEAASMGDLKHIIVQKVFRCVAWDEKKQLFSLEGIDKPEDGQYDRAGMDHIRKMTVDQRELFLAACTFGAFRKPDQYNLRLSEFLREGADAIGLDVTGILQATATAYGIAVELLDPPKPSWLQSAEDGLEDEEEEEDA